MSPQRYEKCGVEGKDILPTKDAAREYLRSFRAQPGRWGRGRSYRCSFGDHYHVTKGLRGHKGKDIR